MADDPSPPSRLFIEGHFPGLTIDGEEENPNLALTVVGDVYSEVFKGNEHTNWLGSDVKGKLVVSILTQPEPGSKILHKCLLTTGRGTKLFTLNIFSKLQTMGKWMLEATGAPQEDDPALAFIKALQSYDPTWKDFVQITDPSFPELFCKLESKHPQDRSTLKIGIVYAKPGQVVSKDMFANKECSEGFWKFVNKMGSQIDIEGWPRYRGDMRPPGTAWFHDWKEMKVRTLLLLL